MATSFAAFASQYLNKNPAGAGSSSRESSQPMFFSFTTDEGSRAGNNPGDADLDDLDDPHLRTSDASTHRRYAGANDDDDPYLRLDEDEERLPGSSSRYDVQSRPLLSPESLDSPRAGWLAHQASPMRSPSPSSSSLTDSPPPELTRPTRTRSSHVPDTSRAPMALSLTESLLPRDGSSRPVDVFSLPDPRHTSRTRRKYNDAVWTSVYLTLLSVCLFCSFLSLFLTGKPKKKYPASALPYTTLLRTVPLLTILTFVSAGVAYVHVWALRVFVKPVMVGTSVFIPATLFISALWAFIGSFMWDGDKEPTWGETVGLRLFSLIPLVLAAYTARRLVNLPRQIHTASSLLILTTNLLMHNPFVLLLSPALLLAMLLLSIPFVTLIFRLLLIGYFERIGAGDGWEWHVKGWANWAIVGVVGVWLWSWGVARGILRVTTAGVMGAWYFADPVLPPPPPTSTHTIHSAVTRATSPSLGTVILSALLLTSIRLLSLAVMGLRALPFYLPPAARPVASVASVLAAYGENATSALSALALVYTGLTGDAFFASARRARALAAAVDAEQRGGYSRRFKTEAPLTILTIAPLTLSFPFALSAYLFVAHTLGAPESALGAAVLAGGVTSLVGKFCVGVIRDTADTLYMCYCIDKDIGQRRRAEVFEAFEYNIGPTQPPQRGHPPPPSVPYSPPPSSRAVATVVPVAPLDVCSPPRQPLSLPPEYGSPSASPTSSRLSSSPPHVQGEDIDPFEQSVEGLGGSSRRTDAEEDEEQLFPGSDFF